jgi:hypothetical protein
MYGINSQLRRLTFTLELVHEEICLLPELVTLRQVGGQVVLVLHHVLQKINKFLNISLFSHTGTGNYLNNPFLITISAYQNRT